MARLRVLGASGLLAGLSMLVAPVALGAQEATADRDAAFQFSVERLHGTTDFHAEEFAPAWLDARHWAMVEEDEEGATELWRVEAETGERERIVAASELVPEGADEPIRIEHFGFSADGDRLLIFTDVEQIWRYSRRGTFWAFDLGDRALRPVSQAEGPQMLAKFSPDGDRVAYVRDGDLWLSDLSTGEERQLTEDGGGDIINGTTDWVYEEELVLWDGYRWGPDGRRIAYWRFDQGPIPDFYLIDETRLYPEVRGLRYPKAGTDNSRVRLGVLDLESGATTWLDVECWNDCYLPRMDWAPDGGELVVQLLNRHQNRLEVRLADPETGATRTILAETDDAWLDVTGHPTWLADGERFLWTSERDGWNHVYLYGRNGTELRQLTRGAWEVTDVHGVDEERDVLWLSAAYESPLSRALLEVPIAGGEPRVVLGGRGVHDATFAPDFGHFVHIHSTIETPPVTALRRADGSTVRVLEENRRLVSRLDSLALGSTEFMELEAADGTALNAWMIHPSDFDDSRSYGLLLYVYGGPGSQTVLDRWGGVRHLWHQWLAERGVLVASVDNRGTGARGRDFRKQLYLRLGELETEDQLAALRQLGERPYVDAERLGIWGWSYGGYLTLLVTLQGGDRVAAGVSVAPVTDWRLYDTIYTERFMRTPDENPEGYEAGAPLAYAGKLEGALLLAHGTGDDNVHFQNTLLMARALNQANKQYALRIYPNLHHALTGEGPRVNLHTLMSDFLLAELSAPAGLEAGTVPVRAGGER